MRVIYERKTKENSDAIVVTINAAGNEAEAISAMELYDEISTALQLKRICRRWRKNGFGYTVRVITGR